MHRVESEEDLIALYGTPGRASVVKIRWLRSRGGGEMLGKITEGVINSAEYDAEWPARAAGRLC